MRKNKNTLKPEINGGGGVQFNSSNGIDVLLNADILTGNLTKCITLGAKHKRKY